MKKIDYRKEMKLLYSPPVKEPVIVDVPEMNFIMVNGSGDPNTAGEYKEAIEALYALSYALKFMVKKGGMAIDYCVMPLEGLWWTDEMSRFSFENKTAWKWTSMIMQPDFVSGSKFREAVVQVKKKKSLPALSKARFESFHEGLSAQIMYIGSYSSEESTVEKLHKFIDENGYERRGKHHEIYLSDPRRSAPEKVKTVIRQPIRKR